uniref:Uncharacterized protein n=1 Tax=Biomphalaria glabrata TaxID=6526 RepID=A0A2C9L882_BIOGL
MSSYYYKVTPPPKPPVMIGTKRISQEQLVDVVARLSRPSSAKMSGLTNSQQTTSSRFKKRVELDLERFLRRIQRPTLAHQLSRQRAETTMDSDSRPATAPRPLSRVELDKVLTQLSRSTAASRAKSAVECHLCGERDRELNKRSLRGELMRPTPLIKTVSTLAAVESMHYFCHTFAATQAREQ